MIILAFAHTQSFASGAYLYSGNNLVELMREYDASEAHAGGVNYYKLGVYSGYILGVCDATGELYDMPATGATAGQILAVVSRYLKNHPQEWSQSAKVLVVNALQEAFPLKSGK
jgi:hypothetical protein